jgi:hypothetical protein
MENDPLSPEADERRFVRFTLPGRFESFMCARLSILSEVQHFVVQYLSPDNRAIFGVDLNRDNFTGLLSHQRRLAHQDHVAKALPGEKARINREVRPNQSSRAGNTIQMPTGPGVVSAAVVRRFGVLNRV